MHLSRCYITRNFDLRKSKRRIECVIDTNSVLCLYRVYVVQSKIYSLRLTSLKSTLFLPYFNKCMPTGWSRVRVPKGWASRLVTRLVMWWWWWWWWWYSPRSTLFISLEWWKRPSFIFRTACTGLLDYSRIVRRDSSSEIRPISTSRCWVESGFDTGPEDFWPHDWKIKIQIIRKIQM